jgi:hypothetical protein
MRIEQITHDRRRCLSDVFDANALALLPGAQRALLGHWLKSKAQKPKWDTLLKIAIDRGGLGQIDVADSLVQFLAESGAVILEQRRERSAWKNSALLWRDYEALNAALGLTTSASRRAAFDAEWDAAKHIEWQRSVLADACRSLSNMPPDQGRARLTLLIKLNDWLASGRTGTRYEFSLFGFGQTKHEISQSEWSWLEENVGLEDCGILRHAPALWIAGDFQLQIGSRWLDIGAACDAVALTPSTLDKLAAAQSRATHYRLIENRTSFERLARYSSSNPGEIILWLPGYAPSWWRTAASRLLESYPAPARISCDADPDGVQIAMQAATLWTARGLTWEPWAMHASDAARSAHKLQMTGRDMQLAQRLLDEGNAPPAFAELLHWCMEHECKAEQENWIGSEHTPRAA